MRAIIACLVFTVSAAGQGAVEYTLGAGRAAGAAGGMSKVGKGVTISLEKATGKTGKSSGIQKWTPTKAAPQRKPNLEDPKGITEGMTVEELLRRFGEPDLKASAPDGSTKYWYGEVVLAVREEKVVSVSKPEPAAKRDVVVIQ